LSSLRAVGVPSGILDEVAFYRLEGWADADVEMQTSVRRGMLLWSVTSTQGSSPRHDSE